MQMKRVIVVFLLIASLSIFLLGCRGRSSGGDNELKWAMWDYDMTVYYKPLIEAYHAKNPGVKIEHIDLGSASYGTVLLTQLSGGVDLDIITVKDIPCYSNLIRQNRLEPLNNFIINENIDTNEYGGVVEQLTVNGEVFALPFRSDFWLIYYNKDIFDAAGVSYPHNDMTLDQYDAIARQVTSGSGSTKTYGAHYHTWRSAVQLFGILDGQNSILDGTYDFLTPYYNRVHKLQDDGIVMPYTMLRTSGTHYSGVFFNNQTAMLNMGTWFIATVIDRVAAGEASCVNWGLAKYPRPAGVPAGTTIGTITGIGVNRNSKKKDLALDFIKFVSGPEGALILAQLGTIPAMMSEDVINTIAATPGFPEDEGSKEALNVYKTYLEMPLHERSAEIEVVLNEAHDAIMTKNTTILNGIKQMNEHVGAIFARQ